MHIKKIALLFVSVGLIFGCQFERYVAPPSVQPLFADENANAELGILSPRLTEEMAKLAVMFKRVDRDQDGLLTETELQNHPDFRDGIYRADLDKRKRQALLWLNYSDRNLDQQLSWSEIANNDTPYTPMERLSPDVPSPNIGNYIAYVFYKLDKDNNDRISSVELAKHRDYPFVTSDRTTEEKVLEANEILNIHDQNKDGEISNEEFMAFMQMDMLFRVPPLYM